MHSYYFLSTLGPAVQKHLWWKRYLTQLQLVQFVILFFHMMIPLFEDCGYPLVHMCITLPQGIFFFVMFMRFYTKSYTNRQKDPHQRGSETQSSVRTAVAIELALARLKVQSCSEVESNAECTSKSAARYRLGVHEASVRVISTRAYFCPGDDWGEPW
ncbi:hypothetical protein HPB48_024042 [Haemaphysalis longicornis]|uniref:Elongation of very long chain fatty acids protein n=1 Tax=Haemaphysalis longicornis TaxID=44386 RepID=A0A9J6GXT4_HAELO|nr:hypothetical protein HPB48_024042 [Haemaphysalis longicornis]